MSGLRARRSRDDADGRLPVLLRVPELPHAAATETGRLLCVLLLWLREMPAATGRRWLLYVVLVAHRVASLRKVLPRIGAGDLASRIASSDRRSAMSYFKGPAVDPEAFRVAGHCCGIRLPVLKTLTDEDEGLRFELTPEARTQLVAEGLMRRDQGRDPPKTSERRAQRNTDPPSR